MTSLYRYSTLDEAIERANAVRFGLSASIFTRDLRAVAALHERDRRRGSSTSTRRPRAPTCTCRSAASRAPAGARTSRAAPRSSSTPRRSPSTRTRRLPERAARSSPARSAASAPGRSRRSSTSARSRSASTSAPTTRGSRLVLAEDERARVTLVEGDVTDGDGARPRARRARDHARRPPRRAAGAVLPRRPDARRPRQRPRHGRRLRGGQGAARPDPRPRLRELDRRLQRRRSVARAGVGRHGADDALRRLQARERGHGARLLARRRRRVDRDPAVRRVRAGPRPGPDVGAVARDGGRGARRRRTRSRYGGTAQYDFAPDVGRAFALAARAATEGAHVANFPGVPSTMQEVVDAIEAAAPDGRGQGASGTRASSRSRSRSQGNLLERLVGPLPRTPLADGVRATIEHFRAQPREARGPLRQSRSLIASRRCPRRRSETPAQASRPPPTAGSS